jgi:hypothetical protein
MYSEDSYISHIKQLVKRAGLRVRSFALAVLCWQPYYTVMAVWFCPSFSVCHVLAVMFRLSCSAVLSFLSSPGSPVLAALFCLSSFACPVLPLLFCQSNYAFPVLPVFFCLSCSACSILVVFFSVLSFLSCPGCLILVVMY